jgi:putative SbcD/Mre11-related phosphoesterase
MLEIIEGLRVPEGKRILAYRDTLIVSDIHLGYESEAESEGAFLPRVQLKYALQDIKDAVASHSIRRLVIAGDLKHKFEALSWQERVEIEKFIKTVYSYGVEEIILVRGNHDTFIKGLLSNLNVRIVEDLIELGNNIAVTHGHMILEKETLEKFDVIIMGHEHPVVAVKMGGATVSRFPVFQLMPLDCCDTKLLVMPALGVYQSGNPISFDRNGYLSPIIKKYGKPELSQLYISDSGMTIEMPEMRYLRDYLVA